MPCALSQNTNIYKEEYCLNLHKQQTKNNKWKKPKRGFTRIKEDVSKSTTEDTE
ncbi:hypothetical protein BFAG_01821 [Bacteroides fragilis 3_1_12]|uniref:Uncharacterized protein n=1 Tax=Bacteroides fragilis 3_1_12 TaxID=457424 RepID=A0ABN0BJN9_BACFG|nr:hypothetical protein BFAG_01821 [Bacteroides fragilis 3_1_12]